MSKKEIMKELLERYEQLENMDKTNKSALEVLHCYIRKLELKLVELIKI